MSNKYPIGEALVVGLSAVAAGWATDKGFKLAGAKPSMTVATFVAALVGHYAWRAVGPKTKSELIETVSPKRILEGEAQNQT